MTDESAIVSTKFAQYSNSDSDSTDDTNSETGIIELILRELNDQNIPDDFMEKDIHGRIEIIEGLFDSCESFVRIEPMRIPKSNDESLKYEHYGNEQISKANYNEALWCYNKSIAFAEKDYQYLYKLYQIRANALRKMKLFNAYLHSLELAIKYCPTDLEENLKQKKDNFILKYMTLQSREERIRSECQADIDSLTTLKNDRKHPNAPFIANCVELKDISNYGRGITAKCDLNPGDVVAIDRAYALILYSSFRYKFCSNCLKENWSLIPCPDCTTAMYCNQKCLQIDWKKFHKHECKISNYLMEIFPENYLMYFRAPLQTIELFGSIDKLIEFEEMFQQIDMRSFNVFNVDHDDDSEVVNYADNLNFNSRMSASNYHCVHGLIKDVTAIPNSTRCAYLETVVFTFLIYRLFRNIYNIETDNQKRFVETFIYRNIMAAIRFNYGLYLRSRNENVIAYGSALFPFAALMNHSCAPNVILNRNGTSATIIVLHPIKEHEQLFYSYGPVHLINPKLQRQGSFKLEWDFTCQCIACLEDYPLCEELSTSCMPHSPSEDWFIDPKYLKLNKLVKLIKLLFMFRCNHFKWYPCKEIGYYEDCVTEYLSQLSRRCSGSTYMKC